MPPPRAEQRHERSERRTSISGNRAFRFACERCRLSRGEVDKKNLAFTLSEVLITLGIIGVVAALTMPSLIQHHKKSETSARLKKFYSMMTQAILLSQKDNDSIENWDMITYIRDDHGNYDYAANSEISKNFFYKYIAPYIKYTKVEDGRNYLNENGIIISGDNPKIYLADGSTFTILNSGCMDITYDINGKRKPNQDGKDIYTFLICPQLSNRKKYCRAQNSYFCAYYINTNGTSRNDVLETCKRIPQICSGLLEQDNWIFKDDYPYRL